MKTKFDIGFEDGFKFHILAPGLDKGWAEKERLTLLKESLMPISDYPPNWSETQKGNVFEYYRGFRIGVKKRVATNLPSLPLDVLQLVEMILNSEASPAYDY